ncbi:uncharacterized protein LOC133800966 isoform X2 [Humulus lupulus]|uniref:uncharacterized protein LOC133800966 isoform X2 n=1 Tax=Humulus lupulus TaxID=3486 RepID=UPI002B404F37|nr:uncharacterized protein LOC133800966 isoform X2 [Humulus lupulus]
MASSQVEIASSSPFGCVLRDHNRRDGCRESNFFQKRFKNLVRDHLHTCISIQADENSLLPKKEEKINQNQNKNENSNERDEFSYSQCPRRSLSAKRTTTTTTTAASIKRKSQEAELSSALSTSNTPRALPRSDSLAGIQNLGASSLVQIWEKRLNHSISENQSSSSTTSRSDSGSSCNENAAPVEEEVEEAPRGYEAGNSVFDTGQANEDSLVDWHCNDKTGWSGQYSPARSQNSDPGESERVRVADIIKRLTAANLGQTTTLSSSSVCGCGDNERGQLSSPTREGERTMVCEHILEHRVFSPRIRGRQAFTDLLMQMERERHGELNRLAERAAVSRFPQRGRIQSMIRLRLLKRGVAVQDQQRLQLTAPQVERLPQGSSILHLRERFSYGADRSTTLQSEAANPRSPQSELSKQNSQLDNSSIPNKPEEHSQAHEVHFVEQENPTPVQDSSANSIVDLREETCSENRNLESQETADVSTCFDGCWDINDVAEELEENYLQYADTSYDWITDISRPRSYWEDRRQAWYQEMLNSNSEKVEIRQLLERGTVSSFLASDFREKMDKLMESRLGRQTHPVVSQGGEEKDGEHHSQLMSFIQDCQLQQQEEEESDEEEEIIEGLEVEEEAEREQEESLISGQYHEASDYFNQSTSSQKIPCPPSLLRSWSFHDNEVGDDSDRAFSTSPRQDFPSESYYHNSRHCSSSRNHSSMEMELIFELRGQMEQLSQEMSELRNSLKSCMDMQMMLMQQSGKQETQADGVPKKGNCRICDVMKVDSLLYRCGHMCTCFKCAHELQWSSANCPICGAPIVDVVRAYWDS